MLHEGFRSTADFGKIEEVLEALKHQCPDVLVLDTGLEDGDVCDVIKQIRNYEIGDNPFVPVIVTTWDPDRDLVRRVANCGTDAMLVKPISPGQLFERMEALAFRRRPFVVTSDYTGPDRRSDDDRGSEIPQIEVPNTLLAKANGTPMSPDELHMKSAGRSLRSTTRSYPATPFKSDSWNKSSHRRCQVAGSTNQNGTWSINWCWWPTTSPSASSAHSLIMSAIYAMR